MNLFKFMNLSKMKNPLIKGFISINLLIFISLNTLCQNVQWAKLALRSDNANGIFSTSICLDNNENSIIAGYYNCSLTSSITFESENITGFQNTSTEFHGFFAKYNPDGNINWVRRIGNSNANTIIKSIVTDNIGNIYILGDFNQSCKFGCSESGDCSSEGTEIFSSGNVDIFISKYDPNGNFLWAKTINSPSDPIYASKIIYGQTTGNIYVCGKFSGTTTFGEGVSQVILTSTGANDIFVASYNTSGDLNWVTRGAAISNCEINGINVDLNENIFIVGTFNSQITFDTHTLISDNGLVNPFLVKMEYNGNTLFAQSFSSTNDVVFNDVAIDYFDNSVYITGFLSGNISFGSNIISSDFGNEVTLLAKFDNNCNFLWAKKTGLRPDNFGGSKGIAISSRYQGCYLAGNYKLNCEFDLQTLNSYSTSNSNIYFSSWDANGNLIFIERAGGANTDSLKSIASNINEKVAIASVSFGSNPLYPNLTYSITWGNHLLNPNKNSSVCSKVKFCTPVTIITEPIPSISEICPGDDVTFSISASGSMPISYQWYNSSGAIPGEINSNFTASDEDTYYCVVSNECSSISSQQVEIIKKSISQAPVSLTFSPDSICANTTTQVTLVANGGYQGTGAVLEWFSESCGGNSLGTGNPISVDFNVTSTPTIFARYSGDCNTTSCKNQTLHVDLGIPENPTLATASRTNICPDDNGVIILRLLGEPTDPVVWYTEDCGSGFITIGSPVSVPSPGQTTTYYGRYENSCGVSGCQSVTVFVIPYPETPSSIISDTNFVCSDYLGSITLNIIGGFGDEVFWSTSSCGIDTIATGNPIIISAPDTSTSYFARYVNMCGQSDCDKFDFIVIPRANASITNPGVLCSSDEPIYIQSAEPGGVWGGNFIDPLTGLFDQNSAGGGQHLINYTISGQCGDYDETIIDVVQAFDATITNPGFLCVFTDTIFLSAATTGGIWTGEGIINDSIGIFNPSLVGIGDYMIYYENNNFCGDNDSINIMVIGKFEAEITSPNFFCNNIDTALLIANPPIGLWLSPISQLDGTIFPSNTPVGIYPVTFIIPGPDACGDTVETNISIIEKIFANITSEPNICIRDTIIQLQGNPNGGIWIGQGVDTNSGILDMSNLEPGNYTIFYSFPQNCGDLDSIEIIIHPYFNPHIWVDDSIYNDSPAFVINHEQDGGNWWGIGVNENGIFDPAVSSFGEFMIIYSYDDGFCYEADTLILKVHFRPYSDLVIPTIITPNEDNHNDTWDIKSIENYEYIKIKIYTRWGDQVFAYSGSGEGYSNPSAQWNGKYKGKDLPDGGYLYILEINNEVSFKGTISLIR